MNRQEALKQMIDGKVICHPTKAGVYKFKEGQFIYVDGQQSIVSPLFSEEEGYEIKINIIEKRINGFITRKIVNLMKAGKESRLYLTFEKSGKACIPCTVTYEVEE